jgi:hypothetical protein
MTKVIYLRSKTTHESKIQRPLEIRLATRMART